MTLTADSKSDVNRIVLNSTTSFKSNCTPSLSLAQVESEEQIVETFANLKMTDSSNLNPGFRRYSRHDDCCEETCKFKMISPHFHCIEDGCKYFTKSVVPYHRLFHKNLVNKTGTGKSLRFYTNSDCNVSDCGFNGKLHYHCSLCKCNFKTKPEADKHSLSHNLDSESKETKSGVTSPNDDNESDCTISQENISSIQLAIDPHENLLMNKRPAEPSSEEFLDEKKFKTTTAFDHAGATNTEVINGKLLNVKFTSEDTMLEKCATCLYDSSVVRQLRTILHLNNYYEFSGMQSFDGLIGQFFNSMKDEMKGLYKTPSIIAQDIRDFMRKSTSVSKAQEKFPEVTLAFWNLLKTLVEEPCELLVSSK